MPQYRCWQSRCTVIFEKNAGATQTSIGNGYTLRLGEMRPTSQAATAAVR